MQKKYLILLAISLIIACNMQVDEYSPIIKGLATPFQIQNDTMQFYLTDYVSEFEKVDSLSFPDEIQVSQLNDSVYQLVKTDQLKPLGIIRLYHSGKEEDILSVYRKKQKIVFQYPATEDLPDLKVIGTMNNWNRENKGMEKVNGVWQQEFMLTPGVYEYLFYSEGREFKDPENPLTMGRNSMIKVGKYLPEDLPQIITRKFSNKEITLSANEDLTTVFAFWQNKLINVKNVNDILVIGIPPEAKSVQRSHIRVFAGNKNGLSNDILIPLNFGKVIEDPNLLNRKDKYTMIMYFLMVDRFCNGDTSNDKKVPDPEILPRANYMGGDLTGVDQKIKEGYFSDLGINTVWLSPILQNPEGAYGLWKHPRSKFSGYHGYWPVSNIKIDYRFGTKEGLDKIVNDVHAQNMNVLLDYVANHVHKEHPVYKMHPDWATDLYLPDGTLNTEKWDEHRLTTWFDTFLPTLDLRRKDVVDAMVDSATYWVKNFDIDGFRHDATKHIDELYWRTLTEQIKKLRPDGSFYQIGETYGSPVLISSYINSGMLDAQFDFNTYDNASACFALDDESFSRLKTVLSDSWKYYGYHNLMGNISGNQDRARFISYAGGDLSFSEDAKLAGWTRNVGVGNRNGYDKLKMLHAFNMTIPGIPVIYYGDEIGMPGGNDPDNRRMMRFTNLKPEELDVKKTVKELTNIRRNNMALIYGDTFILQADEDIFALKRIYFDNRILILFNKSSETKTINYNLDTDSDHFFANFKSQIAETDSGLTIEMKPLSFEIINY